MVRDDFTITEKAPTRGFSWLKAPTSAFTSKTQAALRLYANQTACPARLTFVLLGAFSMITNLCEDFIFYNHRHLVGAFSLFVKSSRTFV